MNSAPPSPYVLGALLGEGHFGEVYRARHAYLTNHEVALKLLRPQPDVDVDALLAEARQASTLADHDNVVKVRDAGIWTDGRVFIASDLCELGSLEDTLIDGAANTATASILISATCRGLSHVHQAGLLHLDIRPANIMMGEHNVPKLTDFGLSQWAHHAPVADFYAPHAAPEFVEIGEGAVTSDVYAMGMTLAHMLTGGAICRPFPDSVQLIVQSMNGDWPRLDELGIHVPDRLRKVVAKATDYHPDRRHPTIDDFKRDLDNATPAVGLDLYDDGSLRSKSGDWTVELTTDRNDQKSVTVKRDGRKRKPLSVERVDAQQSTRHVRKIVKLLADGKL